MDARAVDRLREEIVAVGQRLYARGLVVATDGNISARIGPDRILTTPSGVCKGFMTPEDLVVVDLEGRIAVGLADRVMVPAGGPRSAGDRSAVPGRPTSELAMHLEAYRRRPDIGAVVHAHSPHAVALSIAGIPLAPCALPEALVFVGVPPTVPYATPSSPDGAAAIRDAIAGHDALVLARHGSLAVGASPTAALHNTETLEQLARVTFLLRQLGVSGEAAALDAAAAARLVATREGLGLGRAGDAGDFCAACGVCHPPGAHPDTSREDRTTRGSAGPDAEVVREVVARVVRALELP